MSYSRYCIRCIWIIGVLREEERDNGLEEIFKEIFFLMVNIFLKLMEDMKWKFLKCMSFKKENIKKFMVSYYR